MRTHSLPESESPVLLAGTVSKRALPVNLRAADLPLFSHELEKAIPPTKLIELKDVQISPDGVLSKRNHILPESFAFPTNIKQWKLRSIFKLFLMNQFSRRPRVIESDVLWITDDWSYGYFHWMTDVLSRLFVMRDRLYQLLLLLPAGYESFDFVQASLNAFGVKAEFIGDTEVVKCRRIWLPTHTAPSGHYHEPTIQAVRDLLRKAYADGVGIAAQERIYISRGRARKRQVSNEPAIAEVLAEFEFKTVYSEDLSFEEQVKTFARARYLVSNHGAGLTNMMFAPSGTSVLELRHETDAVNNCYFTLASALHMRYFYQTCQSQNGNRDAHVADLLVDPNALRENLKLMLES